MDVEEASFFRLKPFLLCESVTLLVVCNEIVGQLLLSVYHPDAILLLSCVKMLFYDMKLRHIFEAAWRQPLTSSGMCTTHELKVKAQYCQTLINNCQDVSVIIDICQGI